MILSTSSAHGQINIAFLLDGDGPPGRRFQSFLDRAMDDPGIVATLLRRSATDRDANPPPCPAGPFAEGLRTADLLICGSWSGAPIGSEVACRRILVLEGEETDLMSVILGEEACLVFDRLVCGAVPEKQWEFLRALPLPLILPLDLMEHGASRLRVVEDDGRGAVLEPADVFRALYQGGLPGEDLLIRDPCPLPRLQARLARGLLECASRGLPARRTVGFASRRFPDSWLLSALSAVVLGNGKDPREDPAAAVSWLDALDCFSRCSTLRPEPECGADLLAFFGQWVETRLPAMVGILSWMLHNGSIGGDSLGARLKEFISRQGSAVAGGLFRRSKLEAECLAGLDLSIAGLRSEIAGLRFEEGAAALQEGRLSDAETEFRMAVGSDASNFAAWSGLGHCALLGSDQGLFRACREVLEREPEAAQVVGILDGLAVGKGWRKPSQ